MTGEGSDPIIADHEPPTPWVCLVTDRQAEMETRSQGPASGAGTGTSTSHYVRAKEPSITWFAAVTTYMNYALLIVFGRIRDFFGR